MPSSTSFPYPTDRSTNSVLEETDNLVGFGLNIILLSCLFVRYFMKQQTD